MPQAKLPEVQIQRKSREWFLVPTGLSLKTKQELGIYSYKNLD